MKRSKHFLTRWLLPPSLTKLLVKILRKNPRFRLKIRNKSTELDLYTLIKYGTQDNVSTYPMKDLRYIGGRSFSIKQNHLVRFFKDGESALSRFYELHQPKNVLEQHFIHDYTNSPPIGYLPWCAQQRIFLGEAGLLSSHGHQAYGPVSSKKCTLEAKRLKNVLKSVNENGYVPESFGDHPRGFLLVDDISSPATHRFLITGGQHRVATLSWLNFTEILVTIESSVPREIKISEIDIWPGVASGIFSQESAYKIFYSYFRDENTNLLNGW